MDSGWHAQAVRRHATRQCNYFGMEQQNITNDEDMKTSVRYNRCISSHISKNQETKRIIYGIISYSIMCLTTAFIIDTNNRGGLDIGQYLFDIHILLMPITLLLLGAIGIIFGILSLRIHYGLVGVIGIIANILIVLVGFYLLIDQNISKQ